MCGPSEHPAPEQPVRPPDEDGDHDREGDPRLVAGREQGLGADPRVGGELLDHADDEPARHRPVGPTEAAEEGGCEDRKQHLEPHQGFDVGVVGEEDPRRRCEARPHDPGRSHDALGVDAGQARELR